MSAVIENSLPFQGKTHSLRKRDIREVIKSKRSLLSGEGVRNPCLVKNGKYPPYPPCNVKAVSDLYWTYMERTVKICEKSLHGTWYRRFRGYLACMAYHLTYYGYHLTYYGYHLTY